MGRFRHRTAIIVGHHRAPVTVAAGRVNQTLRIIADMQHQLVGHHAPRHQVERRGIGHLAHHYPRLPHIVRFLLHGSHPQAWSMSSSAFTPKSR